MEQALIAENHTAEAAPDQVAAGDPQAIARLHKWGGDKLVREMTALFLAQVPERIAAAREGLRELNAAEVERAAHSLKSSCSQLGAARMQTICAEIERLSAAGELNPVPELVDRIESEFARYAEWLGEGTHKLETVE